MAGKFALIIGNSQYQDPNLTRLKAPEADVDALSALLRDPLIGAFDDVITLANELSATIRRTIAHFFAEKAPEDLLVLYFSGHGVLDDRGELFLATRDTERKLISGTAIPAAYITGEMDRSRSKRQVLILDCCHSGAFARGTKGVVGASVGTASAFQGTGYGRVVLTATDATQFAWEGDQVIGQAENSLFTHYMIEGLRTGAADTDGDGRISVDNLYDYVFEQVVKATPKQTPGKWAYKEQGEIVIANNPKPVTQPAELPRELRDAINSPVAGAREGTVGELERLLNGPHPGFALAALEALNCLASDDSRRVASAATRALNAYEAKRPQEQARAEQERVAKEKTEAERIAREKAEQERLAREKAEQERLARVKEELARLAKVKAEAGRVTAAPVTAPERKAVAAETPSTRRPWVVLVAGVAVLCVFGIVCAAVGLNALVPRPISPTPAPTTGPIAIVPTVSRTRTPTAAFVPPITSAPIASPTRTPTRTPTTPPPLLCKTISSQPSTTEWRMEGYDDGNTFWNSDDQVLCPPLKQVWSYMPASDPPGTPVSLDDMSVAGGVVVMSGEVGGTNSKNGIFAASAQTGKQLWEFVLPDGGGAMSLSPAVYGGLVFFGGQNSNNLYALDVKSGQLKWQQSGIGNMYSNSPKISNGTLYANALGLSIWAVEPLTGRKIWTLDKEGTQSSLAIEQGVLLRGGGGGPLAGIDLASGKILWRGTGTVSKRLIAVNGTVYAAYTDDASVEKGKYNRVAAFDVKSGKKVWDTVMPDLFGFFAPMAFAEGTYYIATTGKVSAENVLYALDIKKGGILKQRTGFLPLSAIAAANGVVYVCSSRAGPVYALEPRTLETLWKSDQSFTCQDMVIAGGRLYMTNGWSSAVAFENAR